MSARSFGHRDRSGFQSPHHTLRRFQESSEQPLPQAFAPKPRKEFYEPFTESDFLNSGLSFSVVPGLIPDNSIKVRRKEIAAVQGEGTRDTIAVEKPLCPKTGSTNTHESDEEGIYENCTTPESIATFDFNGTNISASVNSDRYDDDDSTIYESIHPPSLNGDFNEMGPGSAYVRDSSVTSFGLNLGYDEDKADDNVPGDGHISEESLPNR